MTIHIPAEVVRDDLRSMNGRAGFENYANYREWVAYIDRHRKRREKKKDI